jgi:F-type H+-transporting ATPase subunit epsilon
MDKIKVEVLQPLQIKIDAHCDHVIIPGIEGDFGIFSEHTPFITKIRPGILKLYSDEMEDRYAIHDGFVTIENNIVKIVCEVIEKDDEVDINRAEEARDRAEKRMKSAEDDIDFRRAELALKKALVRLKIKNR